MDKVPVSAAGGRRLLHTRRVECNGYLRDDGGFDIEATMQDISIEGTEMFFRKVAPGGQIHSMRIVVGTDADLVIQAVRADTEAAPTVHCGDSNAGYAQLVGLKIGPGFTKKAKALFGGTRGCVHMTELLGPLATAAIQTWYALWRESNFISEAHRMEGPLPRPSLVDSCQAYRIDGPAMQMIWPPHRRAA